MRKLVIAVAFSLAFGGVAVASDYIVVNSSDPAIKRGQAFDAGAKVALGAGKSITLMRASGELVTVRGAAAGATIPGAKLAAADAARFEAIRSLVQPPPEGRTFGARRGGICPAVESLVSLDDIVRTAETSGCKTVARQALDAYLTKNGAAPETQQN
ncbi:hypothetical protein [Phenylobacterium sp.]|uniref:hypothetical protein n=1 Tax=Phenylobacterium sp. TaxID=1871053 RepID=UPI0025D8DA75|nr:hypothetical protein [Phenylobacterium sp.]MBX3482355.1 hypothetical protein [Phenylobacterium sp.]MCW5760398.1 hypothetical protein [Phenylobacterium sp.]